MSFIGTPPASAPSRGSTARGQIRLQATGFQSLAQPFAHRVTSPLYTLGLFICKMGVIVPASFTRVP